MKHPLLFDDHTDVAGIAEQEYSREIGGALSLDVPVEVIGDERLHSYFPVSALAVASVGAVASSIAGLTKEFGTCPDYPHVRIEQRLAALWFHQSIYPVAWELPPVWDSVAGDYQTSEGWIKLHTNLEHHRNAALRVLEVEGTREEVAAAVLGWDSNKLEAEIVKEGGVAAAMRSRREWERHPQGVAVASEPLITWGKSGVHKTAFSPTSLKRPLEGLRVLDLTRVLAGPVATRTLAGFGADVLRIDPPGWDEAFVVPDITLGKRCACLQLEKGQDRETFEGLLKRADVFVHGYRPGALDNLGYGRLAREKLSPNLIEVSLDAYGWTGPWAGRRGFDSLVQMSSGIADIGMNWAETNKPTPLPVQALDHATGYLMAAAVIRLVRMALRGDGIGDARLSLARTAELLVTHRQNCEARFNTKPTLNDFSPNLELTPWGPANRLRPAFSVEGVDIEWKLAANKLGSSPACWPRF